MRGGGGGGGGGTWRRDKREGRKCDGPKAGGERGRGVK